ncbi:hypothetical protein ABID99_005795 [Mucilaginibacter sp. OAE612]|uniref:hypothetical protein n=1 Tax=Mucilaginibacter sp. OAE612 TaxID=3156444 RepID=UPI00359CFEB5
MGDIFGIEILYLNNFLIINHMLTYLDHELDTRVDCYSIMLKISIGDYLKFIQTVYKDQGGIKGQRAPLKTKSAQRIRKRLIDDLKRGTVIPPIVLGLRLDNEHFTDLTSDIPSKSLSIFQRIDVAKQVSIIDGMQRTTALYEAVPASFFEPALAVANDGEGYLDVKKSIRLEIWVAKATNSLIYRMLVLNSGQIPWNIKRQLEVVFTQLKTELEGNVNGLELNTSDDKDSRKQAGQYQASQFIELFMLFGAKRINIDVQEELAEEFARLDIIATSGNAEFMNMFYGISRLLVGLDQQFSRVPTTKGEIVLAKHKTGLSIFSSQPARAGFVVAASQEIFGVPGIEFTIEEQKKRFDDIRQLTDGLVKKLSDADVSIIDEFIDLPTLDERTNKKSGKVGEFERAFFLDSFKTFFTLLRSGSLTIMTPCWSTKL